MYNLYELELRMVERSREMREEAVRDCLVRRAKKGRESVLPRPGHGGLRGWLVPVLIHLGVRLVEVFLVRDATWASFASPALTSSRVDEQKGATR